MKLSYIYPHRNRLNLLQYTWQSLLAQTDKDFDIYLVDHSDDKEAVKAMVADYRGRGLDIKLIFIDPARSPLAHSPDKYAGNYSPVLANNIGIKRSTADVIVLTSPEVVNAKTNVARIKERFTDGKSRFYLAWIGQVAHTELPPMQDGLTGDQIKKLCSGPHGAITACREQNWSPENYFIGAIRRNDILKFQGFEECLSSGFAFDDNFFADCVIANGIEPQFDGGIVGTHLAHDRSYQVNTFTDENPNYTFYTKHKGHIKTANEGRDWGTDQCIIGIG